MFAQFADDAGRIGQRLAQAVDFRLEPQAIVGARFEDGKCFAGFGQLVLKDKGAVTLAFVSLGGGGIEGVEGFAGFLQLHFKRLDAFEIRIQAVLGIGEFFAGLVERLLGDGFGLEGFEIVFDCLLGGLGLGQGMFEFLDALAGRQIILDLGFVAGNHRGVELAAQPPT